MPNPPAPGPDSSADYRTRFLQLALQVQALRFGTFTLKSGRASPYFFNAGQFHTGAALNALAACYADALDAAQLDFDLLFGPAYKGIPLATALGCEYARRGRDLPIAFNRKEAKTHGEGGQLIGAPLQGRRVLIVDDVITAGTAVREAIGQIVAAGGSVAGLAIALDRQEAIDPDASRQCAADRLASEHGIAMVAVAGLDDLLGHVRHDAALQEHAARLQDYRRRFGSQRT